MSKEQTNMMSLQDVFDAFENGFQKTPQKKIKVNQEYLSSWTGSGQGVRDHCREGQFSSCQGTATSNALSKSSSPYEIEFDVTGNPLQCSHKSIVKCNNEEVFKLRKNRDNLFEKRSGFQQSLENIQIENESEQMESQSYEEEEGDEESQEEEDDSNILAEDEEEDSVVSDVDSQRNDLVDKEQIFEDNQSENIPKFIDPEKENKDPLGLQSFPRERVTNQALLQIMNTPQQTRNASRIGILSSSSSAFVFSNPSATTVSQTTRVYQNQSQLEQQQQQNQFPFASGTHIPHAVGAFTQGEESTILQLQEQLEGHQETTTATTQFYQNHQIVDRQTPNSTSNHPSTQIYHSVSRPSLQRTPLRDITTTGCSPKVSRWDLSPYIPTNIRYSAQIQQQTSQEKQAKDPQQQQNQSSQSLSNRSGNPPASLYR